MTVRILHNPRCSKSRATLDLLRERGIEPEITLYLDSPPSCDELRSILRQLGLRPAELVRRSEAKFRELGLDAPGITDEQLLDAMTRHPRLIERPIVLAKGRAAIGRPPEAVLAIL